MDFWLGVTDNAWFDFLSRSALDEVNFWQPSGTAPFTSLPEGTPFLFKLKRPYNHVAGGGYLAVCPGLLGFAGPGCQLQRSPCVRHGKASPRPAHRNRRGSCLTDGNKT